MKLQLTVEFVLLAWLILWLFGLLDWVSQRAKDIVYSVSIVLLIVWFFASR